MKNTPWLLMSMLMTLAPVTAAWADACTDDCDADYSACLQLATNRDELGDCRDARDTCRNACPLDPNCYTDSVSNYTTTSPPTYEVAANCSYVDPAGFTGSCQYYEQCQTISTWQITTRHYCNGSSTSFPSQLISSSPVCHPTNYNNCPDGVILTYCF